MMIRWMCNVSLKDGRSSDELKDRLEILDITEVLRRKRLWFEHLTRINVSDPACACRHVEVEGKREQGRPKKSFFQLVSKDLKKMKLNIELAQDQRMWIRANMKPCPTHGNGRKTMMIMMMMMMIMMMIIMVMMMLLKVMMLKMKCLELMKRNLMISVSCFFTTTIFVTHLPPPIFHHPPSTTHSPPPILHH